MMKRYFSLALLFLPLAAFALKSYPYPAKGDDLVGKLQWVYPKKGDRIYDIARRYNVGYYELIESNPTIYRHSKLPLDKKILIPTEYVLPNVKREGIVINLPELRLYYYNSKKQLVQTTPIAIGRFNWGTPELKTKVIEKQKDPVWYVPESIKEAGLRKGIHYPDKMPAGPKNPLGKYMLRLGERSYLLHGTNNPTTIGKRASSGCMRMFPESVEKLFDEVPVGTPVAIINEPVKVGWRNGALYLESHEPLHEAAMSRSEEMNYVQTAIHMMTQNRPIAINWQKVHDVIERDRGIPVKISGSGYSGPDYQNDHSLLRGEIEYVSPSTY